MHTTVLRIRQGYGAPAYNVDTFVDYRIAGPQVIPLKHKIDRFTYARRVSIHTEPLGPFRLRMEILKPSGIPVLAVLPSRPGTPHLLAPLFGDVLSSFRTSRRPGDLQSLLLTGPEHFLFKEELLYALIHGKEQVCAELGR